MVYIDPLKVFNLTIAKQSKKRNNYNVDRNLREHQTEYS